MYDLPWLHEANDALWDAIARRLRALGWSDVPECLERTMPLAALWRDERLLLAQTCGYPLVKQLVGKVRVVAAPCYSLPRCEETTHRSVIVVASSAPYATLGELRGCRIAINGPDSNTGMNLFRHALAGIAPGGERYFASVAVSGGHMQSLAMVADGTVDAAAIDAVTFALSAKHRPDSVSAVRVLAATAATPTLPFITRHGATPREVAALRGAIEGAIADPDTARAVATLALAGVRPAHEADYAVVTRYERQAVEAGYPELA